MRQLTQLRDVLHDSWWASSVYTALECVESSQEGETAADRRDFMFSLDLQVALFYLP